jgi:hemerythrin-like domain-containing protein
MRERKNTHQRSFIKIVEIIIEQFVDQFHHGKKEENSYFPKIGSKGSYSEEIRKFVIEHEQKDESMLKKSNSTA